MKWLLIVAPIVIVGIIAGLGVSGVIKIPGLSPAKSAKSAAINYGADSEKAPLKAASIPTTKTATPAKRDAKQPKSEAKPAKKDVDQGADALATVWNEIKTPELISISKDWKDDDLVKVLVHMDNDKVAKFLDELAKGDEDTRVKGDPLRASKLSKVLQDLGSIVKDDKKA